MDNAFEKARAAYGTGAYDDATLEFIFPELKESEDDRIRKWLIDYFKNVGNTWIHREISPEQILSYLEKQKDHFRDDTKMVEQKLEEWSERYIADVFEKVGLAKIVREQGNDALTNAVQSAMIELSNGEKQEWSEEDVDMLNSCISSIEEAKEEPEYYQHFDPDC